VTLFNQGHLAGSLDARSAQTGLGGAIHGTLREFAAFDEQGLVHMPKNLNWLEGSTLSCAALTAWNALYGLESRALKQGDTVLTQGTGGVSIFALQVNPIRVSCTTHQGLTRECILVCQICRCNGNLNHIFQRESRSAQEAGCRPHYKL
jgi:hypothetical protein